MSHTVIPDTDLTAAEVAWDLATSESDADPATPAELVDRAEAIAHGPQAFDGKVATLTSTNLAQLKRRLEELPELLSLSGHYTSLKFSENTTHRAAADAVQRARIALL